jgi:ankyrin repeat protein
VHFTINAPYHRSSKPRELPVSPTARIEQSGSGAFTPIRADSAYFDLFRLVVIRRCERPYYAVLDPRNQEMVALLLDSGADVKKATADGYTLLHFVVMCEHSHNLEMVALLLDHGADVNKVDLKGRSPLYAVSDGPKMASIRIMLEYGPL